MSNVTSTIYGAALQAALLRNLPLEYLENTTLNEKFNILASERPKPGQLPTLNYFAIGKGGHRFTSGADGEPMSQLHWHRSSHASLYQPIPFVVRPVSNDLDAESRTQYALRRKEMHDGKNYYVYYLRRMPASGESPRLTLTTYDGGVGKSEPFIPSANDLSPTPPLLSPDGTVPVSGQYLTASATASLLLTKDNVTEIINGLDIIEGGSGFAVISEVALVSGLDKVVTIEANGAETNMNEAICCQCVILETRGPTILDRQATSVDFVYDMGMTEQLSI